MDHHLQDRPTPNRCMDERPRSVVETIRSTNPIERQVAEHMDWAYIEGQSSGSAVDVITRSGAGVELKFDWDSIRTGNHYLEFAQTSDGWVTSRPSGFALSEQQADYWCVVNEAWLWLLRCDELGAYLRERRGSLRTIETRSRVNGNQVGQFSRAYLVPLDQLSTLSVLRIPSPVSRPSPSDRD